MEMVRGSMQSAATVHSTGSSGGILFFVFGLAVFAGLSILGIKRSKKHQAELMRFAVSAGWQYVPRDDRRAAQWQRPPFDAGYNHRATNVLLGAFAGRQLAAFDYSYEERTTDGRGNSSSTTYHFAVCALALPVELPYLEVGPESVLSRLGSVVGVHDIEIESEEFNRKFRVHASDPKFASDVLSPRLAQTLLSLPPYHWRTDGASLVSWSKGVLQPKTFQPWFSALSGVIDSIPAFVWHDRGVSTPTAAPIGQDVLPGTASQPNPPGGTA
jgi:LPXTG-motif cell wall-anchored protein